MEVFALSDAALLSIDVQHVARTMAWSGAETEGRRSEKGPATGSGHCPGTAGPQAVRLIVCSLAHAKRCCVEQKSQAIEPKHKRAVAQIRQLNLQLKKIQTAKSRIKSQEAELGRLDETELEKTRV